MPVLHLEQFKNPTFLGYVENRVLEKKYLLNDISAFDRTFDMSFDYDVFTQTYAPTAAITGWNAGAPLRDKQGFKTITQEVAKIQHGFRLDEREILKFMNPRVEAERENVIRRIYDQTDRLIQGVNDTEEWLRAQAVYNGQIVLDKHGLQATINFGLSAVVNVATAWSNRGTATPLDDLRTAVKAYKDDNAGQAPRYLDISGDVLLDLTLNSQIRKALFGVNNDMLPTRQQVETILTQIADAPIAIRVNDDVISIEGAAPTRLLNARRAVLLGEQPVITVEGPTVEKNFDPGIYVLPIVKEGPPPSEEVYVGKSAFVGIQKPSEIYRLSV